MVAEPDTESRLVERCPAVSWQLTAACAVLLAAEIVLIALALWQHLTAQAGAAILPISLPILWLIWMATQATNYRLVRCGPLHERYRRSPVLVNRPEPIIRLGIHFVVNWSALVATLVSAFLLCPSGYERFIAAICAAAALLMWAHFNWLHRRMNHVRNLVLSSSFAGLVLLASAMLARV